MDILAVTDFPDIRFKTLIQSADEGNIVIIPREGGYLVRIYVEMDKLAANERVAARNITVDRLIAAAQRIMRPYTLDVKEVAWWSVYEIGQRLCDKFDDVPADRVRFTTAARVHRRRCLPYPQSEGRAGHECLHAGCVQSRVEARVGPAGTLRAGPSAHLFGGASRSRQGADRVRSRMGEPAQHVARGRIADGLPGVDPAEIQRYFVQRPLYRWHRNQIQAVSDLRRAHTPAPGQGLRRRHALSLGAGHPPRRRQADAARTHHQGRRPLAHLPICRCGDPASPASRIGRCASFSPSARVPGPPVHASARGHRYRDRCAGDLPAGASRA